MLLPEHGPDLAVCEPDRWSPPLRQRISLRRRFLALLQNRADNRMATVHSAMRLAQILVALRYDSHTDWSDDPSLVDRLEAHLAITDDVGARKALATYLCEP
jgi:hypothetical protein